MSGVILGEKAIRVRTLAGVLRSRIQLPPRHLLPQRPRGLSTSTGILRHRQKPINATIGNTDLELSKLIDVIRYRVTLCGPKHMMSSGDNLDQHDMVEADDRKKLLESS